MPLFVKQEGVWELGRDLAVWDGRLCLGSLRSDHGECPEKMPHCPPNPQGPPVDIPGALGGHGDHLRLHIPKCLLRGCTRGQGTAKSWPIWQERDWRCISAGRRRWAEALWEGKRQGAGGPPGRGHSLHHGTWEEPETKNGRGCGMPGLGPWQCRSEGRQMSGLGRFSGQ